ncbi:hypothetical protein BDF21DRAFT_31288 [Thamnidium elegans]|nr:hypothetical protein BDF21DRAFT_31288 [Thamnidium elegans]
MDEESLPIAIENLLKTKKGEPPISTKYSNVRPTIIHDKDGKKLVIGTQTFNALITSSLDLLYQ